MAVMHNAATRLRILSRFQLLCGLLMGFVGGAGLDDLRYMARRHALPAPGQCSPPANTIPARTRPSIHT